MYKFVIKNIAGAIVHTSVNTFNSIDKAQRIGYRFFDVRKSVNSFDTIVQKGNYIDVISV